MFSQLVVAEIKAYLHFKIQIRLLKVLNCKLLLSLDVVTVIYLTVFKVFPKEFAVFIYHITVRAVFFGD